MINPVSNRKGLSMGRGHIQRSFLFIGAVLVIAATLSCSSSQTEPVNKEGQEMTEDEAIAAVKSKLNDWECGKAETVSISGIGPHAALRERFVLGVFANTDNWSAVKEDSHWSVTTAEFTWDYYPISGAVDGPC